jgi:hypothetical protein
MGQFCIFPYIFFLEIHLTFCLPTSAVRLSQYCALDLTALSVDDSLEINLLQSWNSQKIKGKKEKNGYYKERLDGEAIALLGLLGESAMGTQQQQRGAPEHTDSGQVAVCVCSRETRRYLSQVIGKVRIWARSNRSDICMGYLYIHMDTHTRRCVSLLDVSSYSSHTAMYI